MAKKIRFPLKMKNGAEVGSLYDLKENFDYESVLGYFTDGKLQTWLSDRFYYEKADAVSELSADMPDIESKLRRILEIEVDETNDNTFSNETMISTNTPEKPCMDDIESIKSQNTMEEAVTFEEIIDEPELFDAVSAFERIKRYLIENRVIPKIGVDTWIKSMKPCTFSKEAAVFEVGTQFQSEAIIKNYLDQIKKAYEKEYGFAPDIKIRVNKNNPLLEGAMNLIFNSNSRNGGNH
ncbi:MAG TPA: DnaA N-terminal domain-containing protein [Ruminococcus sp.]|nr:DnaA N-terminal domain-containing protein [Ruminococcus sp.]